MNSLERGIEIHEMILEHGMMPVNAQPDSAWKLFKEHQENGSLFVREKDGFKPLDDGVFDLAMSISQGDQIYRKMPEVNETAPVEFEPGDYSNYTARHDLIGLVAQAPVMYEEIQRDIDRLGSEIAQCKFKHKIKQLEIERDRKYNILASARGEHE